MFDIISIGAATKDVFLISKGFKLVKTQQFKGGLGECFAYGSKVEIGDIYFDTGGGATNSAYTFANLGLNASIVSKVGNDIYGTEIMHVLAHKGVDTRNLNPDKTHKTAYSTILVVSGGDRTILVYRGASANFNEQDFNWSKLQAKWFYISSLAGNISLLKKIFAFAKKKKIKIAWNPGSEELKLGASKLKTLIKDAYVFNLNKEEAQKLTGKKDIKSILKAIDKMSPGYNIVTDGANGAYLSDGILIYHANALKVPVVNTTGAGDAFGSGFCAGMILKNDWDYGLRLAILNSAGTLTAMGAKNGLLKKIPKTEDLDKVKIQIIR
ncbi:carbohydrate kinase family protein [Candidatus Falkowbacteria bacterium]|nr:carbohydrate kinase family protein [Candidatus Falkowbacteria bacterium]